MHLNKTFLMFILQGFIQHLGSVCLWFPSNSENFWLFFSSKHFFLVTTSPSSLSRTPIIHRLHDWILSHRSPGFCHFIFLVFFFSLFWLEQLYLQTHWSFLLQCLVCCESHPACFLFFLISDIIIFSSLKVPFVTFYISYLAYYHDYVFLFLLEHMEHILIAILTSLPVNYIISATCEYLSSDLLFPSDYWS